MDTIDSESNFSYLNLRKKKIVEANLVANTQSKNIAGPEKDFLNFQDALIKSVNMKGKKYQIRKVLNNNVFTLITYIISHYL